MGLLVKLNHEQIYNKTFTKDVKGYNAYEVDQFLDLVIADYLNFEKESAALNHKIKQLSDQLKQASEENEKLNLTNAELNKKVGHIKDGDEVNSNNLSYINRIRALETFIHNLGHDPSKIK